MAELTGDSAAHFARAAKTWEPNDWWRLEARAWHAQPAVLRALAFFSPKEVWKDLAKNSGAGGGGCLRTVGHIIALAAPTVMAFVMVGLLFQPGRRASMLIVGIVMLVALLWTGLGLIHDLRRPDSGDARSGRLLGMFHLVPSAVSLIAGAVLLAQGRIDEPIVLIVFAADVVLGAVHLFVHRIPAAENEARWERNIARLKSAIAQVSPAQKNAIEQDLHHAFDELFTSGLISEADRERARTRSLGLLGMGMAPRPDLTFTAE